MTDASWDTRWDAGPARAAALGREALSASPRRPGTDAPQAGKVFSEPALLGGSQGGSRQVREENTPRLFPCTLDHGHLTNCQLRGCRERCVGARSPISISPEWRHWRPRKAKFLVHRGPVGKSQASCLLTVLQSTTFISEDPHNTFPSLTFETQPCCSKNGSLACVPRDTRLDTRRTVEGDGYRKGMGSWF